MSGRGIYTIAELVAEGDKEKIGAIVDTHILCDQLGSRQVWKHPDAVYNPQVQALAVTAFNSSINVYGVEGTGTYGDFLLECISTVTPSRKYADEI